MVSMAEQPGTEAGSNPLERRKFLKRAAAGTALVWAAPAITSISKAYALLFQTEPICPHGKCVTGSKLEPGCGPCEAKICDLDPYCCNNEWDSLCVQEVRTICNSLTCSESMGRCPHTLCTQGGPMTSGCDSNRANCVRQICAKNPLCCSAAGEWNEDCVNAVNECINPAFGVNTTTPLDVLFCNCT